MIIDCHCHFDMMPSPERYILQQERADNIVIGMTNLPSHFKVGAPYVKRYKHIRLALGLHPLLAVDGKNEIALFKKQIDQTSYIGEIGLDFSKEGVETKDDQLKVLREILAVLKNKRKIVSVHSRKAEKELFDLLCEYDIKNVIFHWYSGPVDLIPFITSQGYYFSINEAMLVSKNGRSVIDQIPRNRILTETDAPYNTRCNIQKVLSQFSLTEQEICNNFKQLINAVK